MAWEGESLALQAGSLLQQSVYMASDGVSGDIRSQDLPGPFNQGKVSFTIGPQGKAESRKLK
jgi:hypothetical protein